MTTWNSTTPNIKAEIQAMLDDATFETGGNLEAYLLPWANRIVQEICNEVDIRLHLSTDTTSMVFTTADTMIALPSNWNKISYRFTKVLSSGGIVIPIIGLEELRAYDPAHTATTTNSYPDYVAIEGGYMYPYPLFAGILTIDKYYRIPTDMSTTTDMPDIPLDNLRTDLVIAGVIGKYGFPALNEDKKAVQYYNATTAPKSGRFFELLEDYRRYLGKTNTTWSNRGRFF